MGKLKNENKDDKVLVRMSVGEKVRLLELSDRYEITMSAYLRQLVRREYELTFPQKSPSPLHQGTATGPVRR